MKKNSLPKSQKAFTLIELLVVIAIIGLLATISILALQNARAKSRDAKRVGDAKQIQTALELFFSDNNRYPTVEEWNTGKIFSTTTGVTSTYMQIIPNAPTPADGNCSNDENVIYYTPLSDGSSYTLSFCLGGNTGTLDAGPKCLTSGGILDEYCGRIGDDLSCPGNPVVQYAGGPYDAFGLVRNQGGYYRTVLINGQCWLRDNLNLGSQLCNTGNTCTIEPDDSFSMNDIQKYCFANDLNNCAVYGGLYPWPEAIGLPNKCKAGNYTCSGGTCTHASYAECNYPDPTVTPRRGICPSGWHIPSDVEQDVLDQYAKDSGSSCNASRYGDDCANAGSRLKSSTWNGTDEFGFGVLPAGGWSGWYRAYADLGTQGVIWSSSPSLAPYAQYSLGRYFDDDKSTVYRDWNGRNYAYSIRCLKD